MEKKVRGNLKDFHSALVRQFGRNKIKSKVKIGYFHGDFIIKIKTLQIAVKIDEDILQPQPAEQIIKDLAFQRSFLATGCVTVLFAATEVQDDPKRCAREVRQIVQMFERLVIDSSGAGEKMDAPSRCNK